MHGRAGHAEGARKSLAEVTRSAHRIAANGRTILRLERILGAVALSAIALLGYTTPAGAGASGWHVYVFAGRGDKVTLEGGCVSGAGGSGGPAEAAGLGHPEGISVDPTGDLFIAEGCLGTVDMVASTRCSSDCAYGLPSTLPGYLYTLWNPSPPGSEYPSAPSDVAVDGSQGVLIADLNQLWVWFLAARNCSAHCPYGLERTTAGGAYVIAGDHSPDYNGNGIPADSAGLGLDYGVAVDRFADVLVTDETNNLVRMVAAADCAANCPYGLASTTVGYIYTIAKVSSPDSVAVDRFGDVFVGSRTQPLLLVAGRSCSRACPYGMARMVAGSVYDPDAGLVYGLAAAADRNGNLLFTYGNQVQILAARSCSTSCPYGLGPLVGGQIYVVAGTGRTGHTIEGASARSARLDGPWGVAVDGEGDLLVADSGNCKIVIIAGARVRASTSTTVTSSVNPVAVHSIVTYTARVRITGGPAPVGFPSGLVHFTDNGSPICATSKFQWLTGGVIDTATCKVRYASSGSQIIRAAYSGDWRFAGSAGGMRAAEKVG